MQFQLIETFSFTMLPLLTKGTSYDSRPQVHLAV